MYLKNLETKKPETDVKYYEGKDNEGKPKYQKDHQKDNNRPYKKNYNNNNHTKSTIKAKDEKEYDSDGFEVVNSQQKKIKEPYQHRENKEYKDKGERHNKNNYNNKYKGDKKYNQDRKHKDNKEGQEAPVENSDGTKLTEIGIKGEIKKQEKETITVTTTVPEGKAKGLHGLFA